MHPGNHCYNPRMPRLALLIIAMPILLAACATQHQKSQQNEAIRKRAAQEIARICALPEADRQAEIERIKKESDVAIYCP